MFGYNISLEAMRTLHGELVNEYGADKYKLKNLQNWFSTERRKRDRATGPEVMRLSANTSSTHLTIFPRLRMHAGSPPGGVAAVANQVVGPRATALSAPNAVVWRRRSCQTNVRKGMRWTFSAGACILLPTLPVSTLLSCGFRTLSLPLCLV